MPLTRFLLALALLPAAAAADFSATGKFGTTGAGVEAVYHFDEQFALRASVATYTFAAEVTVDDIDYDVDLNVRSAALIMDIFPSGGNFYFSGGVFLNGNVFEAVPIFEDVLQVGSADYTAAELGDISGEAEFKPVAPYIGLGYRWRNNKPGLSLGVEAGILFQGQGDVTIDVTGPIADTAEFQADLAEEIDDIEDQLGVAKLYPVLEARIAYRF